VFAIVELVKLVKLDDTRYDTPFGKRRYAMQPAMLVGKRTPIRAAHVVSLPHSKWTKSNVSYHFSVFNYSQWGSE
jgi:hypothetical protein